MNRLLVVLLTAGILAAAGDPKVEKEAMAAMESFRQAFLKKDMAALDKLLNDDLVYTHSAGETQTKAEFLKAVASGPTYVRFDVGEPIVHAHGDTVVLRVTVELRNAGNPERPNPLSILHVWIKGKQGWQLVARQSTRPAPPAQPQTK